MKLIAPLFSDSLNPPIIISDRISNRCISRMDHFCPWMNNAIGAKNQKNFLLFLIYTDLVSAYMYVVVAWHMVSSDLWASFKSVTLNNWLHSTYNCINPYQFNLTHLHFISDRLHNHWYDVHSVQWNTTATCACVDLHFAVCCAVHVLDDHQSSLWPDNWPRHNWQVSQVYKLHWCER